LLNSRAPPSAPSLRPQPVLTRLRPDRMASEEGLVSSAAANLIEGDKLLYRAVSGLDEDLPG